MAEAGSVSDEKVPVSPTASGTTAVEESQYDEEAGCEKDVPERSIWRSLFTLRRKSVSSTKVGNIHPNRSLTHSLEQSPVGYPVVANFQSSDPNFLHYRGFLNLHSRLLSDLQYDIECLERELKELDEWDLNSGDPRRLRCLISKDRDRRESKIERMPEEFHDAGHTRTRPEVLQELKTKLMEYDEVLLKARDVHALQRPSNRDHRSVCRWFTNKKPLVDEEAEYIRRKEDLVTLRTGRECGGFDGLVEQFLSLCDRCLSKVNCDWIQKLFMSPELREKTKDKHIHYYSPQRVDVLVNIIITAIIFTLLIIPVVVLYELSCGNGSAGPSAFEAIGILIIFTLLFGGAMSSLTTATRQELFAASAAYCAVLVVFISNFTTQNVTVSGHSSITVSPSASLGF